MLMRSQGTRKRIAAARAVLLLVSLLAVLALAPAGASAATLQPIGSFDQPIFITSPPASPNRLFVVQRAGLIKQVQGGSVSTFADLTSVVRCCDSERGLLSMAPAPDFDQSGLVYVDYTGKDGPGNIHVAELKANGGDAPISSLRNVLTINHSAAANHNGGQLQFGPDGDLYVSVGDGGADHNTALDKNSLLGKILRIDPRRSGSAPYSVPAGNPFVGAPGADEVWAYGFRNPYRFSFDRQTGDLLIGDVGEATYEEVDFAPQSSGGGRGAFYGWDCREGFHAYNGNPFCPGITGYTDPIFEYPHAGGGCAITGGYVARDPSLGDLVGRYLYADYCLGQLRSLVPGFPATADRSESLSIAQPVSFGEDACGRLYVANQSSTVYRIAGSGALQCSVLRVTLGGKGKGKVLGPGIDCPGDCVEVFPQARQVTLQAQPQGRSIFRSWHRDCGGLAPCKLQMSADRDVVARFGGRLRTKVKLFANDISVPAGASAQLHASAQPCKGRRHDKVNLYRGHRKVAVQRLNRHCVARFAPRASQSARFHVKLLGDRRHRPARSRTLRITAG